MVSMRAARATASPKKSPSSCSTSPRVMTMRIARRSSPLFNCVRRNSSCIAIAASAAAVTLGKVIQNPSPWALTIRPSFPSARRQTNSRCSVSNADRSACGRPQRRCSPPRAKSTLRLTPGFQGRDEESGYGFTTKLWLCRSSHVPKPAMKAPIPITP
jgi:hypothetical protein